MTSVLIWTVAGIYDATAVIGAAIGAGALCSQRFRTYLKS
jgi:hypothetical protein